MCLIVFCQNKEKVDTWRWHVSIESYYSYHDIWCSADLKQDRICNHTIPVYICVLYKFKWYEPHINESIDGTRISTILQYMKKVFDPKVLQQGPWVTIQEFLSRLDIEQRRRARCSTDTANQRWIQILSETGVAIKVIPTIYITIIEQISLYLAAITHVFSLI